MKKSKYSENELVDKKLPVFYDYYDCRKDFDNVYEPAEDTFLLTDVLGLEKDVLISLQPHITSVELGCGSGYVSAYFVEKYKTIINKHFCVDINNDALGLTKRIFETMKLAESVEFVNSNLFEYISEKFDIIIFNPPYVTTDRDEYQSAQIKCDISAAWAGGDSGSEIIFKFIEQLENHIHDKTIVYLLLSSENEIRKIITLMKQKYNFTAEVKIY